MGQKLDEPGLKYDAEKPAFELLDASVMDGVGFGDYGGIDEITEALENWLSGTTIDLAGVLNSIADELCGWSPHRAVRLEVARILEFGAWKYAAHNWRKGMSWSRVAGAALRHLEAFARGEVINHEHYNGRDFYCHHLGSAACCLMFLIVYERDGLGTDDRFKPAVKKQMIDVFDHDQDQGDVI